MDIRKLHFFDKAGYDLNFKWNENRQCWEGNIYLPKISVGLYSNTSIYVMEESNNRYIFPKSDTENTEITFTWDILNTFVDEFFMFTFDTSYIQEDTSALTYKENDGPECKSVLVTTFDEYKIPLETEDMSRALPVHVAFISLEKYDSNTFKRTLVMSSNFREIARITFFAETIEEDERLRIWNDNLGYNISKNDAMIFKKSNIKEPYPDYKILNEKRKELMIEGHNIYPHIGSYKALLNAIKFFGYDNLNIVEFWRNVNEEDDNFGKLYHVKKYTLTDNEAIFINDHKIKLPNSNYRKLTNIALSYRINRPVLLNERESESCDDNVYYDVYELPYTEECFDYTLEEALIKLFALRDKLNKEFMPGRSKIVDVIGEASYFGLCGLVHSSSFGFTYQYEAGTKLSIDVFPQNHIRITNNKLLKEFIYKNNIENWNDKYNIIQDTMIQNIETLVDDNGNDLPISDRKEDVNTYITNEYERVDIYKRFYKELTETHTIDDDPEDDLYDYFDDSYTTGQSGYLENTISAKVILTNTSFVSKTFSDMNSSFGNTNPFYTFENLDSVGINNIKWEVRYSNDQIDEDLKKIGVNRDYNENGVKTWNAIKASDNGDIKEFNSVFFELPYTGYYDVVLEVMDNYNNISRMVFTKYIKVEPYNLDIRGFYYDARKIPDELLKEIRYINMFCDGGDSDSDSNSDSNSNGDTEYTTNEYAYYQLDELIDDLSWTEYTTGDVYDYKYYEVMKEYILEKLRTLTDMASVESATTSIDEMSMPIYKTEFVKFKYGENEYTRFYNDDMTEFSIYTITYDFGNFKKFGKITFKGDAQPGDSPIAYSYVSEIDGKPLPLEVKTQNTGPYVFDALNEEWEYADNLNNTIKKLIPNIKSARYIKNGVDVKPYTWILLGYENSKISGKCNPHWIVENVTTHKQKYEHYGKFFTLLLKEEGDYVVTLKVDDVNGNSYEISRNLIIVSNDANYRLYTPFKTDYDAYFNEKNAKRLKLITEMEKLNDATYS